MIRVTQFDDDGAEVSMVELDDFTVEILYSGIAIMLREADQPRGAPASPTALTPAAKARRQRVLARING